MYLLGSFVQQNKGMPNNFDDETFLSNFAATEARQRKNLDVGELQEQKCSFTVLVIYFVWYQ